MVTRLSVFTAAAANAIAAAGEEVEVLAEYDGAEDEEEGGSGMLEDEQQQQQSDDDAAANGAADADGADGDAEQT